MCAYDMCCVFEPQTLCMEIVKVCMTDWWLGWVADGLGMAGRGAPSEVWACAWAQHFLERRAHRKRAASADTHTHTHAHRNRFVAMYRNVFEPLAEKRFQRDNQFARTEVMTSLRSAKTLIS